MNAMLHIANASIPSVPALERVVQDGLRCEDVFVWHNLLLDSSIVLQGLCLEEL